MLDDILYRIVLISAILGILFCLLCLGARLYAYSYYVTTTSEALGVTTTLCGFL